MSQFQISGFSRAGGGAPHPCPCPLASTPGHLSGTLWLPPCTASRVRQGSPPPPRSGRRARARPSALTPTRSQGCASVPKPGRQVFPSAQRGAVPTQGPASATDLGAPPQAGRGLLRACGGNSSAAPACTGSLAPLGHPPSAGGHSPGREPGLGDGDKCWCRDAPGPGQRGDRHSAPAGLARPCLV